MTGGEKTKAHIKLFASLFGSVIKDRDSQKDNCYKDIKKHQDNIWVVHVFKFLTRFKLNIQQSMDDITPDIITNKLSFSMRNGETTILAKVTWAMSRNISEDVFI